MTRMGTPNGERGSNKEDGKQLAAAIASANCRRVISILICSSTHKILRLPRSSLPESAETGLPKRKKRIHFFQAYLLPLPSTAVRHFRSLMSSTKILSTPLHRSKLCVLNQLFG